MVLVNYSLIIECMENVRNMDKSLLCQLYIITFGEILKLSTTSFMYD